MGSSATPPKPTGPPRVPLFVDAGEMDKAWMWYLYQVFTTAQQSSDLVVLGSFDFPGDSTAIAAAEDARRLALTPDAPVVLQGDIEELRRRIAAASESWPPDRFQDLATLLAFSTDGQITAPVSIPPALRATSTAGLTTTAAYQDVPGVTLTLAKAGFYFLIGSADIWQDQLDGGTNVRCLAGGIAQNGTMRWSGAAVGQVIESTGAQSWLYQAAAGDIAKLQGKKDAAGGGVSAVQIGNTSITAVWLHE